MRGDLTKLIIYLLLGTGGIFMLLPFVWMIMTSLKPSSEVMLLPPKWIPSRLMWQNYADMWGAAPFSRYLWNSIMVTSFSTLGSVIISILAAFAFARLSFYGRDVLFTLLLSAMMVPSEMLLIPNFVTITKLGWIDRYEAMIVPLSISVFSIYLLRQHFESIPAHYYYAARVDGYSPFGYLRRVMVPLIKPVIATMILMKAIGNWNAYLWPLLVTNSVEMRTLQVGLVSLMTEIGVNYERLMAASTFVVFPMLLCYVFLRKYIIEGVSQGGLKG
ncbi:ABC transporter permease subunit [Paenibacillus sp. LMG 31456]|uniref:ABC transporter permease subunit n=1 Tax=Paenibacillus foliorum TaxID=2654974 RepID=A0A972K1U0_9BACL|nr:carbohydrate ABC transporter permease [Paenibacillus foliorum]NOU97029.1 ABC transporter permease subunit [Paenibacillus foliorum]